MSVAVAGREPPASVCWAYYWPVPVVVAVSSAAVAAVYCLASKTCCCSCS